MGSTFKNISRIWLLVTPQLLPHQPCCFALRNVLIWTMNYSCSNARPSRIMFSIPIPVLPLDLIYNFHWPHSLQPGWYLCWPLVSQATPASGLHSSHSLCLECSSSRNPHGKFLPPFKSLLNLKMFNGDPLLTTGEILSLQPLHHSPCSALFQSIALTFNLFNNFTYFYLLFYSLMYLKGITYWTWYPVNICGMRKQTPIH